MLLLCLTVWCCCGPIRALLVPGWLAVNTPDSHQVFVIGPINMAPTTAYPWLPGLQHEQDCWQGFVPIIVVLTVVELNTQCLIYFALEALGQVCPICRNVGKFHSGCNSSTGCQKVALTSSKSLCADSSQCQFFICSRSINSV